MQKESYKNGYNDSKKKLLSSYNKFKLFLDRIGSYIVRMMIALACMLPVAYLIWLQIHRGDLEFSEMRACNSGDFDGCMKGFVRVTECERSVTEPYRAMAYEEAYQHATGKTLFLNQDFKNGMLMELSRSQR